MISDRVANILPVTRSCPNTGEPYEINRTESTHAKGGRILTGHLRVIRVSWNHAADGIHR
jgi:hypothetical protein